jgi:predicted  nucleic acid-binding Zn-ribbon protein
MADINDLISGEWPALADVDRAIMLQTALDDLLADRDAARDEAVEAAETDEGWIEELEEQLAAKTREVETLTERIKSAHKALDGEPRKPMNLELLRR